MQVISTERIPAKLWLDVIEENAFSQIKNLANLPFAYKHIAIMPDSHQGYGMPIGGVMATHGVIVPNAVGVDIGCGMCAVKTDIKELPIETLKKIMGHIRETVPVGFEHQREAQDESLMPKFPESDRPLIIHREYTKTLRQIGTLGGGNHFIEIQKDQDGYVWMMIHSGSRNFGLQIADHYNKIAVELNEKYYSTIDSKQELAFLPIDTQEAQDYIKEMNYAVEFAFANRKLMMERVQQAFLKEVPDIYFAPIINIAHNYARLEHHFGKNVWVHRKGATSARKGEVGIIPGSQGTSSYIVEGLGNPESFESCSHGAGRKMGRNQAIKNLNLKEEQEKLDKQGVLHGIRGIKQLDEASGAYKDIDVVMENQKDLVKIVTKLTPLAVIKG